MAAGTAKVEEALLGDLQEDVSITNSQEWASSAGFDHKVIEGMVRLVQSFEYVEAEVETLRTYHITCTRTGNLSCSSSWRFNRLLKIAMMGVIPTPLAANMRLLYLKPGTNLLETLTRTGKY